MAQYDYSKYLDENKKMNKKLKWGLIIGISFLLIFLVGRGIKKAGIAKAEKAKMALEAAKKAAVPVEVQKITKETVQILIDTNGDIEGTEKITLYSDYPGKLLDVYVREGQSVSKNQTVAVMNRDVVVQRFENSPIKTLISGVVGKVFLDPGETLSTVTPVMTVENTYQVNCIAQIVDTDLAKISKKDKALLTVDSYPDTVFEGTIEEISPVLDPLSRSGQVKILVPNYKYKNTPLKPGMFASVKIIVGEMKNTLLVPYSSVIEGENNDFFIFIHEDGKSVKKKVIPGIVKHYGNDTQNDRITVTGDIKENDLVVYIGQQFLNDNEKIRFTFEGKKYEPAVEEESKDNQENTQGTSKEEPKK